MTILNRIVIITFALTVVVSPVCLLAKYLKSYRMEVFIGCKSTTTDSFLDSNKFKMAATGYCLHKHSYTSVNCTDIMLIFGVGIADYYS